MQQGHRVEVPALRMEASENGQVKRVSIRDVFEAGGGLDAFPPDHAIWNEKSNAIDEHFSKITSADAILVANYPKHKIDGYIGGNTLMEIAVAYYLKKKIFLLYPVSSKLAYKEEILGVHPIILNEDISLIQTTSNQSKSITI